MKKILSVVWMSAMLASGLTGCATKNTVDPDAQRTQGWSAQQLYNEAHSEMTSGNYAHARTLYAILASRYPGASYTEQAELDSAYVNYKDEEKDKALANIARFQQNYPASAAMDYALYLKGLILFNQDQSKVNRLAQQDWSDRDPEANKLAYAAFSELVQRYPNSRYAPDASERMTKIVEALGGHEIAIARYYMKRGAWLAAANRAKMVLEHYRNTSYVEEAMGIMVTAYARMNQPQLSDDARRVLAANYAQSRYLSHPWQADDAPWWRYWK